METLTPEMILQAYRAGIFPMATARTNPEIHWYDPDLRGILPIAGLHVPKRLRQTIRKQPYAITFDRDFAGVMRACADARPETWINDEIIALYTALHHQGHAHSVEAWHNGCLVGGIYGLAIGAAFFGESMFSRKTNASKIALVHLVARLWRQGFELLDTQFVNEHLKQFGVTEIPRQEYHDRLARALGKKVSFNRGQSPLGSGTGSSAGFGTGVSLGSSVAPFAGAPVGAASVENSSGFDEVAAFLHSITQTS